MAEETKRYRMDTRAFVAIWNNHKGKTDPQQWKRFVIDCYDRFEKLGKNNEAISQAIAQGKIQVDGNKMATDDGKYNFLSEKCYTKANNLRSKLDKELGIKVNLPSGYLERPGAKGSAPPTIREIAAALGFPQS